MSSDPVTLKSFFCDDDGRPVFDCCDPKAMGEALDEAAHLLPHALLDEARTGYARTVEQLFQVRLEDILISGWSSVSALKECIRQSRKRPDETLPFYLADQTLTSTHHPSLEVMLGPTEIARLPFEIDLSLELKAVQLGIRDGRIDSLESGRCKGSAAFAVGDKTLLKHDTPEFALPGRLDFHDHPEAEGVATPRNGR